MGTRNLTMVKVGGLVKVARYGQWDGYPTGQGVTIAEFVQAYLLDDVLRAEFAAKVATICELDDAGAAEVDRKWAEAREQAMKDVARCGLDALSFKVRYFDTWYSRNTGAEILAHIFNADKVPPLRYSAEFLSDFSCEWAYLLDLDACTVSIYTSNSGLPDLVIPFAEFTVRAMRTLKARIHGEDGEDGEDGEEVAQ